VVFITGALGGKRLELLNEVIPGLARVAIIWSPDNPATRTHVDETRRATQALGIGLQSLEVRGADDLSGAFEAAGREHAQAAIIPRNGFSNANRTVLIELAARSHLPAIFVGRDFAGRTPRNRGHAAAPRGGCLGGRPRRLRGTQRGKGIWKRSNSSRDQQWSVRPAAMAGVR